MYGTDSVRGLRENRRKLHQLFFFAALLVLSLQLRPLAQERAPKVRHREIKVDLASAALNAGVVTSDVIPVPLAQAEPFLAVGAAWLAKGDVHLSLRSSTDGVQWSDWLPMGAHEDFANERGEQVSALALLDQQTRFVQYQISAPDAEVRSLRLVFISPGATPREMQQHIQRKAKGNCSRVW